jgi:transcription elongation factor S-II
MATPKIIINSDSFRNNIRSKFNVKINNQKYAVNLEKGIYNFCLKEADNLKVLKKWDNPKFVCLYIDKLRSVYLNLNDELVEKITNGSLLSQNVAFMTHQELNPEGWKYLIEAKIKRDKTKFETNIEAATDTFTCRKCKSNKCTYYQMQTRSADEPMTTFVSCIECGNRWKC